MGQIIVELPEKAYRLVEDAWLQKAELEGMTIEAWCSQICIAVAQSVLAQAQTESLNARAQEAKQAALDVASPSDGDGRGSDIPDISPDSK